MTRREDSITISCHPFYPAPVPETGPENAQCLDEIQHQYDALMAEGILPASPPLGAATPSSLDVPIPPRALGAPAATEPGTAPEDDGARSLTAEGVLVGAGGEEGSGEGEPDADLDLDDDGTR